MLRLTETLDSFLQRLRETAETLDIHQRQKILRLLVKEVLVGKDSITIRHSIQIPRDPDGAGRAENSTLGRLSAEPPSYLLRSGGHGTPSGDDCFSDPDPSAVEAVDRGRRIRSPEAGG